MQLHVACAVALTSGFRDGNRGYPDNVQLLCSTARAGGESHSVLACQLSYRPLIVLQPLDRIGHAAGANH